MQSKSGTSLEVKDGKLKSAVHGKEEGAGIRVLYKGAWGFSATNDLSEDA
ncbi:MAG: DNA gyrase modulator, partial [Thermoplasmata archaeon]